MVDLKADCNVSIYKINQLGRHRLIRRAHNILTLYGRSYLVKMANGTAFTLGGFGLGSGTNTPVSGDTWLQTPLLVTAPTSYYYSGPLYRATLYLDQSQLNGYTLSEAILAPSTDAPPTGDECYARVVFPGVAKTSAYSYLVIFDCTWGV